MQREVKSCREFAQITVFCDAKSCNTQVQIIVMQSKWKFSKDIFRFSNCFKFYVIIEFWSKLAYSSECIINFIKGLVPAYKHLNLTPQTDENKNASQLISCYNDVLSIMHNYYVLTPSSMHKGSKFNRSDPRIFAPKFWIIFSSIIARKRRKWINYFFLLPLRPHGYVSSWGHWIFTSLQFCFRWNKHFEKTSFSFNHQNNKIWDTTNMKLVYFHSLQNLPQQKYLQVTF